MAGALLVGPSLFCVSCQEPPPPDEVVRPVRAIRVADSTSLVGRKFPGTARATREVELSFRVAGTITSFPMNIGDSVERDQVVAGLDPRDFQVAIKDAEAGVAMSRADLAAREDEYQRALRAFEQEAATEFEVTTKREARNAAEAQLASAEAGLDSAQDNLSYATLRAPFAGEVTATYVENFEDIQAKEPVLRIVDDTRIEMVVSVPDHLMSIAPTAMDIRCEFDALAGLILEAKVKEIGSEADVTTRTFPITLIMDQPEGIRVLPGMSGNAWALAFTPPEHEGSLEIPITAVVEDVDGSRFVYVVDETTLRISRRDVEVVDMVIGGVRVRGVEIGEVVVTAGTAFLAEGQEVRLPDLAPAGGDA
jgi:RND family efflux transporter MFP subunit